MKKIMEKALTNNIARGLGTATLIAGSIAVSERVFNFYYPELYLVALAIGVYVAIKN